MPLVRLRPLSEDDVDDVLSWVNDRHVVGNLASFSGEPFTREQELAYIRSVSSSATDRVFTVEDARDARYLGQVGLHQIHWRSRVGRLAVIIGREAEHGKGYGTAAMAAALDVAFTELDLHKVWLMSFETNARALHINAKLGFVREGVLREEYFHEGEWHNMVRMSVLSREWKAARARLFAEAS